MIMQSPFANIAINRQNEDSKEDSDLLCSCGAGVVHFDQDHNLLFLGLDGKTARSNDASFQQ